MVRCREIVHSCVRDLRNGDCRIGECCVFIVLILFWCVLVHRSCCKWSFDAWLVKHRSVGVWLVRIECWCLLILRILAGTDIFNRIMDVGKCFSDTSPGLILVDRVFRLLHVGVCWVC